MTLSIKWDWKSLGPAGIFKLEVVQGKVPSTASDTWNTLTVFAAYDAHPRLSCASYTGYCAVTIPVVCNHWARV